MIIRVIMKTPDAVDTAIEEALKETHDPDEDQTHIIKHDLREQFKNWFEYGEVVHLIVDTDANTCTIEEL